MISPEAAQAALDKLRDASGRFRIAEQLEAYWHTEFNNNVDDWRKASKTRRKLISGELTASWYSYRASNWLKNHWLGQYEIARNEMHTKLILIGQGLGAVLPDEFRLPPEQTDFL